MDLVNQNKFVLHFLIVKIREIATGLAIGSQISSEMENKHQFSKLVRNKLLSPSLPKWCNICHNLLAVFTFGFTNSRCTLKFICIWFKCSFDLPMSGSCHFKRVWNDEFSVECLFWFFQRTWKSNLKVFQITKMISFELIHPYNTLNAPQIVKLDRS